MRTTTPIVAFSLLILAATAGCNGSDECSDATQPGCLVASEKQRISNPDVPAADTAALVGGNTTFALDLYQQVKGGNGNLFYSPYSISLALAMTWAGARTQTEIDMASALDFKLSQDKLHPAFNGLDLALASRGKNAQASDGEAFRLHIANALWGQMGYPFETPFLDTLGLNYGAGMHIVDYEQDSAQAIDLINEWVNKETEGKIPTLVSSDNVDPSTRLVLTNAIYFNAAWATPFESQSTADASFVKPDESKITVSMMHGFQDADYAAGDGYQAVALPYDGNELAMLVILPDAGTLPAFESSFDSARLAEIDGALQRYSVDLRLPKFKFDASFSLVKPLTELGMGSAFSGGADFSGIVSKGGLAIQDVIHKSFVSVNEAGTEAAAATAVSVGETSAPPSSELTLDHPFLFLIRDNATGTVLFVGRVTDPTSAN